MHLNRVLREAQPEVRLCISQPMQGREAAQKLSLSRLRSTGLTGKSKGFMGAHTTGIVAGGKTGPKRVCEAAAPSLTGFIR